MMVSWFIKVNRCIRVASILSFVLLIMLSGLTIIPLAFHQEYTEAASGTATESTLSLDITNSIASVDLAVASASGTFASSDANSSASFSVTTNNYTGYTLSISANDNTGELVNGEESLDTISSSLTTSQFDVSANNGKWGYKPSKYRSGNTTVDNTGADAVYLVSPTTTATTLDITNSANNESNPYTISLGARADYTSSAGTYTKTFTLATVANPINYTINFNKNTEDTVTNMPNPESGSASTTTITLPSTIPVRPDYTFLGWCSVIPTSSSGVDSCTGTGAVVYNPDGTGTNLTYGIDQTTQNIVTLYAMWSTNQQSVTCDNTKLCIQYDGNGLNYTNPTRNTNIVNYNSSGSTTTLYSHTSNISDDGTRNGDYAVGEAITESKSIPGATTVNLNMQFGNDSPDGGAVLVLLKGVYTEETMEDADPEDYITSCGGVEADWANLGYIVKTPNTTMICTIETDTITIIFHDFGLLETTGYGYYATITGGSVTRTVTSGEYTTPTGTNILFHGWSTSQTTPGATLPNNVEYANENEIKSTMPGNNGETKTLYAVWQQEYQITFNMDNNVSDIEIVDTYDKTTVGTITTSGQSIYLANGSTYSIRPHYGTRYAPNTFTKTSGTGTFTRETGYSGILTISDGSATINVTSQYVDTVIQNYSCSNLSTIGSKAYVYDTRDNEVYMIGKLADSNCWLMDNLRLDLTNPTTLTNTTSSNTNATTVALTHLRNGDGTTTDQWPTASINNEAWVDEEQNYYSVPMVIADYKSLPTTPFGEGSGLNGVFYNYCATSAGTYCWGDGTSETGSPTSNPVVGSSYNIDGDICPAGWRLPRSGETKVSSISPNHSETNTLCSIYNGGSCTFMQSMDATSTNSLQYNLSTPLSGYFYSGHYYGNNDAHYWTATRSSTKQMYVLGTGTDYINPYNSNYERFNGYSVRCIRDENSVPIQIDMDANVIETTFTDSNSYSVTATKDGDTIRLKKNETYIVTTVHNTSYMLNTIAKASGAGTISGNQFTVGNDTATIAVTSKADTMTQLQNLNPSLCVTNSPTTVVDTRDRETYLVQRLADGNCWLLDNLRLDLGDSTILASTVASNTNAEARSINAMKLGTGTTSNNYPTAKINNEAWTSASQNYYSVPMSVAAYKDTVASTTYGAGSGKTGVFYNYCAASAGSYCYGNGTSPGTTTDDATEDICPTGWRMPTGNSSGEYQNLYTAYSNNATNYLTALSVPMAGFFTEGNIVYNGEASITGVVFSTSTRNDSSRMFTSTATKISNSLIVVNDSQERTVGISIRCILK